MNRIIPAQAEISPPGMAEATIYPAMPMKQNFFSLYCTPLSFLSRENKRRCTIVADPPEHSCRSRRWPRQIKRRMQTSHPQNNCVPSPLFFSTFRENKRRSIIVGDPIKSHLSFIFPSNCFPNPHQLFKY